MRAVCAAGEITKLKLRSGFSSPRFFLSIFFALMLPGCVTTNKGMYDKTVPTEEQCTLEINRHLVATRFDDTEVHWANSYPWLNLVDWFGGKTVVSIPAGQHIVTFDWSDTLGNKFAHIYDLVLEYNFEPQKVYTIRGQFSRSLKTEINLYNVFGAIFGSEGYDYTKLGNVEGIVIERLTIEPGRNAVQIIIQEKKE
jgi:hypothetical protein